MQKQTHHSEAATKFIDDEARTDWHDQALWHVRSKRDLAVRQVPEWEQLRIWASGIKEHTLSHLDRYLIQLEEKARHHGIHVHWASTAEEHNKIVQEILEKTGAKHIVKSKSMLTEECGLNHHLEKQGFNIIDTDLGERIVQLAEEPPSHIVLPAIHKKKEEISELFHQHLKTKEGNADPDYLTKAARKHLRKHFIQADAAITGVNFAIAETGALIVCTNEGNADMGVHLAKVHIACMGIEKVIPKMEHLPVFLRLLARSATGQSITTYTSHYIKPAENQEMHLVIVDNGRSKLLGNEKYRNSLKCIRCGACLNTCPVYRRSGGFSYHNAVSGPIGAILAPNLDLQKNADLPFASTLCGSCTAVCPVKINIHEQLLSWRQEVTAAGFDPVTKRWTMKGLAWTLSSSRRLTFFAGFYRKFPFLFTNKWFNPWVKGREMPGMAGKNFAEWWKENNG